MADKVIVTPGLQDWDWAECRRCVAAGEAPFKPCYGVGIACRALKEKADEKDD